MKRKGQPINPGEMFRLATKVIEATVMTRGSHRGVESWTPPYPVQELVREKWRFALECHSITLPTSERALLTMTAFYESQQTDDTSRSSSTIKIEECLKH
jgi:hypothetical protein